MRSYSQILLNDNTCFSFTLTIIVYASFNFCFNRESLLDPERGFKGTRVEGLDFFVEHMTWKRLPKEVFEPLGGLAVAKATRLERGFGVVKKVAAEDAGAGGAGAAEGAETGTNGASGAVPEVNGSVQQHNGSIESKESEISDLHGSTLKRERPPAPDHPAQYDLGKKWFSSSQYEGFGAENVDTMEKSRKKLRAEAFGGADNLDRALFDKKVPLKRDLPVLLPKSRLAVSAAARQVRAVPNVVWNLLDGK